MDVQKLTITQEENISFNLLTPYFITHHNATLIINPSEPFKYDKKI